MVTDISVDLSAWPEGSRHHFSVHNFDLPLNISTVILLVAMKIGEDSNGA